MSEKGLPGCPTLGCFLCFFDCRVQGKQVVKAIVDGIKNDFDKMLFISILF
jgi:hypothetical protein